MILLIILLAIVLRLVNLNQSFWLDEAAQMIESSRSFREQIDISADFHPPLYHFLLHFWIKFGNSEIFARLPSVLIGVISVYLIYGLALKLNLKKAALPAALLLAVSPYHIYYSQEVRPYMLFAFLSLLSTFFWLKPDWKKYFITGIFLLYSNYFASFVLASHLLTSAFFRKKIFTVNIKYSLISYLFLLPWLPKLFRQVEVGLGGGFSGWTAVVSESTLRNIPLMFAKFIVGKSSFDNNIIYSLILLPSFLVFIFSILVIKKHPAGKILLSIFSSSLVLAFTVSLFLPIVAPQRLIFLLPVFILIISAGSQNMPPRFFQVSFIVLLTTSVLGLSLYYTSPRFQRENWRQSVNWLNSEVKGENIVLFSFPEPFAPFLWYNRGDLKGLGIAPDFIVKQNDLVALGKVISGIEEVYYYSYLSQLTDKNKQVQATLENTGLKLKQIKDFPGVGFVYQYEKKEY